jgi:hypothetical protein
MKQRIKLTDVLTAISKGAKLVSTKYWNKTEYGVQYNEGGYFEITENMYNKAKLKS